MYRNISLEEGNYVLSEIEKQLNKEKGPLFKAKKGDRK